MVEIKNGEIEKNEAKLKRIGEFFTTEEIPVFKFFIPCYQRGYRWTKANVKALLDDINEIENDEYYCLQPIVVTKNKDGFYELIDGQQRLTTIYLIACFFKAFLVMQNRHWPIFKYESREKTTKLLEELHNIDNLRKEGVLEKYYNECKEDIDPYYIYESCEEIRDWLKEHDKTEDFLLDFYKKFTANTRIIWYEINEEIQDDTSTQVFTRLNKGKIPLDDSELVKAMFLKESKNEDDKIETDKFQNKVAIEWDEIERELQDDKFWYFLSNDKTGDNRINFIFNLIYETKEDNKEDTHITDCTEECEDKERKVYEYFSKKLLGKDSLQKKAKMWEQVTDCFYRIKGWYKKRELYHYIGYLVAIGEMRLVDIYKECLRDKTYPECIKNLAKKIYELVIKPKKSAEDNNKFNYTDKEDIIRNILLLHNILTILKNKNSIYFFSFDKYKDEKWDIEHISPCNPKKDNNLSSDEERIKWFKGNMSLVKDIINSEKLKDITEDEIDNFNNKLNQINNIEKDTGIDIEAYNTKKEYIIALDSKYSDWKIKDENQDLRDECDKIIQKVYDVFNNTLNEPKTELEDENKNNNNRFQNTIANLALLNENINRSYGNDLFPAKRMRIIEEDKTKAFIPLCTKHAFLKYYSKTTSRLWTKEDANAYKNDIDYLINSFIEKYIEENNINEEEN